MVGPSPAEEEAVKRNTDCVYFLASPLTCKKGNECEYRHSDIARVNPRDCWFWLHGSCLNSKCGFRHPPLDGLLGAQTSTSVGHSMTASQNATMPSTHVTNASSKQAVPCVFFQNGLCLKGDWCPFLHVPNFVSNKSSAMQGTATATEPTACKNTLRGHEKFLHGKEAPVLVKANSVKVFQKVKPSVGMETAPAPAPAPVSPKTDFSMTRRISNTSGVKEFTRYSTIDNSPFGWSDYVQQHHLFSEHGSMNIKDVEEVSREPSPGFDVLVDDERRDSNYYPKVDRYGMSGEHEVTGEYDIDPAADYNLIADIDSERFQDSLGYDLHEFSKSCRTLELPGASTNRKPGRGYLERRSYSRVDSGNKVDELDLRHRLNKRKNANGLRSVISYENIDDRKLEDTSYPGLQWDEQHVSPHEKNLSSNQMRGRIRLPGGSSSPSDKDAILAHGDSRLYRPRTSSFSHHGRIQDRIKGRLREDSHDGGKNHHSMHFTGDIISHNAADFTGPKSLAELKNQKFVQPNIQKETDRQSLGKRRHLAPDDYQQGSGDVSFEGPMPLEEILKRKKGVNIGIVSGKKSPGSEGIIANNNEIEGRGMVNTSLTSSNFVSAGSKNMTSTHVRSNKDVLKAASTDKTEEEESRTVTGMDTDSQLIPNAIKAEDGINGVDNVEKDGEFDYEHVAGENYDFFDGENGDLDTEFFEDDDEDDFAKKMGVKYS